MIEDAGFQAVYLSGAALSAGVLALPDVGLFTLTELVQQVDYLTSRIAIPVIVDADTGFGDTVNVERAIADLERAAIQPKTRCCRSDAATCPASLVTAGDVARRGPARRRQHRDHCPHRRSSGRGFRRIRRAARSSDAGAD
jgi:hypothetical protein